MAQNQMLKEFKKIIGTQAYSAFVEMLKAIGPDARTHRISVVIAAMLRFACSKLPGECEEGTLEHALIMLEEEPHLISGDTGEYDILFDLIDELCCEAGMQNRRESARGGTYSVAENAIAEYVAWHNMPWEHY